MPWSGARTGLQSLSLPPISISIFTKFSIYFGENSLEIVRGYWDLHGVRRGFGGSGIGMRNIIPVSSSV